MKGFITRFGPDPLAWGLVLMVLVAGCGTKPQVAVPPSENAPPTEKNLYTRAQALELEGQPDKAREVYGDYLIRYPESSRTPAVLIKLGELLQKAERYDAAQQMYERVLATYPHSPQASRAMLGVLQSLYGQADYPATIKQAVEYMPALDGAGLMEELYMLLGDTYLALDSPVDALTQYLHAYLPASPLDREKFEPRIKRAVQQLTANDVKFLLTRHPDDETRGFLMFQMGLRYIEEGDYEEALAALTSLIEQYPRDTNVVVARELIADIGRQAQFDRYTIGCLLPLSGPYQPYGQRVLNGIELAVNQFSGRSATKFKLIVRDTAGDDSQARRELGALIDARVAAILGPVVTAKAVAEEAQDAGVPLIALTQKEDIPQTGDYIFRNFMTPTLQAETLVRHAVQTLGQHRFAILYPEEPYGHRFLKAIWEQVTRFGGQVTGIEAYEPEQTDFAEPIKKLVGLHYPIPMDLRPPAPDTETEGGEADEAKEADEADEPQPIVDFDALFIPDAPQKAGLIIPQLAFYDIENVQLLGTNLWHAPSLIEMAPRFSQGAIITDGLILDEPRGKLAEFVQSYQSIFLEPPDLLSATGYDSAMIVLTLLGDSRVKFRSSLKTALGTLRNFPGVTGNTSFDASGEVHKRLFLMRVKGDGFETIVSDEVSPNTGM